MVAGRKVSSDQWSAQFLFLSNSTSKRDRAYRSQQWGGILRRGSGPRAFEVGAELGDHHQLPPGVHVLRHNGKRRKLGRKR